MMEQIEGNVPEGPRRSFLYLREKWRKWKVEECPPKYPCDWRIERKKEKWPLLILELKEISSIEKVEHGL